jgi:two-component system OmpR family sensor kinase
MRRPQWPRTIRGRLTVSLALGVTLALATAAVVMVLLVRQVLLDRLDAQLRAAGDRFAVGLEHRDNDADNHFGPGAGQLAGTLGARIYDGRVTDAAIVGDQGDADPVSPAARAQLGALTSAGAPRSIELAGLGDYRIVVVAGRDGDLQVTGVPAGPIEHTISMLVEVVVAVFGAALLAIVLVAAGVLRVMLRPLSRVAATADEVAALPLGTGGGVSLPHRVETGLGQSEVDSLGRAVNAMLDGLESALQTRAESQQQLRRFIADASHELRTPITVVRSSADLALREGAGELAPNVARSLERIAAQSERLGHIVEDLLLLARLDAGRSLASEPVDVVRAALDAVDDARVAYPTHPFRLALPDRAVEVSEIRTRWRRCWRTCSPTPRCTLLPVPASP